MFLPSTSNCVLFAGAGLGWTSGNQCSNSDRGEV